ncbi:MAG: hypothetical protein U9N59_11300, partial [Campylobacterota bacterium]|nr:hypothetical protein [Campylobacterota bacterium]
DYINFLALEKYQTRDNFLKYMNERYTYEETELIKFWTKQKSKEYDKKHPRKSIRFTEDEFAVVEKNMEFLDTDFSTYAKSIILDFKLKTKDYKKLLNEINKIGHNVNQLVHKAHTNQDISLLTEIVNLENVLENLREELKDDS